jgi:hypothetical protein
MGAARPNYPSRKFGQVVFNHSILVCLFLIFGHFASNYRLAVICVICVSSRRGLQTQRKRRTFDHIDEQFSNKNMCVASATMRHWQVERAERRLANEIQGCVKINAGCRSVEDQFTDLLSVFVLHFFLHTFSVTLRIDHF